jgi:hypothetical protein
MEINIPQKKVPKSLDERIHLLCVAGKLDEAHSLIQQLVFENYATRHLHAIYETYQHEYKYKKKYKYKKT